MAGTKIESRGNKWIYKIIGFVVILLVPVGLYAQYPAITVSGYPLTFGQAFKQIEAQSGYTIAYSETRLHDERIIGIRIKAGDIRSVLAQILEPAGLTYKINGSHLIIVELSSESLAGACNQTINGVVREAVSGMPVADAHVFPVSQRFSAGTITDSAGGFRLENLPGGKYRLRVSCIGYEPVVVKEIILPSSVEVYREILLNPVSQNLGEVVVQPTGNNEHAFNPLALTGGRPVSMAEAGRYAGGVDDPGRLITSFAGVAGMPGINGVSVRGNSPQFLQWRVEGVEIPNLTHFADLAGAGGGLFSGVSSQVMGNSGFFTGAFPAEYGNALSGVFDLSVRNGNNEQRKHAVRVGLLGSEIMSEGPVVRKAGSSYIFNYRYFTTGWMGAFIDHTGINFQDLTFKLNFPGSKAGSFSVWGIGLLDRNKTYPVNDSSVWETYDDRQKTNTAMIKAAGGVTHKYILDCSAYFKTSLATVYSRDRIGVEQAWYRNRAGYQPVANIKSLRRELVLNAYFNKKYGARHTNRSGIAFTGLFYDLDFGVSPHFGQDKPIEKIVKGRGRTAVFAAYSNSVIRLTPELTASVGVHIQAFTLNSDWTVEPRMALKWKVQRGYSLSLAYGLHSRREKLDHYFIRTPHTGTAQVNKQLGFAKAHHGVMTFEWGISENIRLKIEPYYQALFDVPVEPGTSFSVINQDAYYSDRLLVNRGKGRNYGVEITLERYLDKGYYYLFTGSVFKSEYLGGDTYWRSTRFDRRYLFRALGGKEWRWGKSLQNIFNLNLRSSFQGGNRYTPVDEGASLSEKEIVYDDRNAFGMRFSPAFSVDLGMGYKLAKKRISHEFGFQLLNAVGYTGQYSYQYNEKKHRVEKVRVTDWLPDFSYKIRF